MHWSRPSSGGLPWLAALLLVSALPAACFAEAPSLGGSLGIHGPPSIATDAGGQILVTSHVVRPQTGADIYAWSLGARSAAAKWPKDGIAVCSAPGDQIAPAAVSDGRDGFIVVWEDQRGTQPHVYAQHVLASGDLDPAWPGEGALVSGESSQGRPPLVVSDGEGGAWVAWNDPREDPVGIRLQQISASGRIHPDWPTEGLRISSSPGQSLDVMLPDGSGGVLIAWFRPDDDASLSFVAQHVLSSGRVDPRWPEQGAVVSGELDGTSSTALVGDGFGGLVAAWTDRRRDGIANVFVRRILQSGVPDSRWPERGVSVSVDAGGQWYPALLADDAGGSFVAWQKTGTDGGESIYAQHLTGSGAIAAGWPQGGLRLSSEKGEHVEARISALGGSLLVTWMDRSVSGVALPYAQRVSRDARLDVAWPAGGAPLAAASVGELAVAAVDADAGIAVWRDVKSSGLQVTALTAQPPVVSLEATIPAVTMLLAPRPNPARGAVVFGFSLASRSTVKLSIFDIQGRRVATLIDGTLDAGSHQALWSTTSADQPAAKAGLYFVRLDADGRRFTKRFATIR